MNRSSSSESNQSRCRSIRLPLLGWLEIRFSGFKALTSEKEHKEFIRGTLGDDFDIAWEMASTLVENHSDLLLVPNDVAEEMDEERVGLTVEDLPAPHPIYDIEQGETLMQLRPILMSKQAAFCGMDLQVLLRARIRLREPTEILNMCTETQAMTIGGQCPLSVSC